MAENLSFATFDPRHAYPPYLNSPRSLEACRRIGIEPIELVEIPIEEFRKDFPNDPTCIAIRYERIDGARRRNLQLAAKEWKKLCETGWKPDPFTQFHKNESIVEVEPGVHCPLLEIQARSFRRFEKSSYDKLQSLLTREITLTKLAQDKRTADQSTDQSTEEYQSKLKAQHDRVQDQIVQTRKMKMQEIKRQEELHEKEMRDQHRQLYLESQEQKEIDRQMERRRRADIEKRESERLKAERYLEELKTRKTKQDQSTREARERAIDLKEADASRRVDEFLDEKSGTAAERRQKAEERFRHTKKRLDQAMEDRRAELMRLEAEAEDQRRKQQQEEKERKRSAAAGLNDTQRTRMYRMKALRDEIEKIESEKLEADLLLKQQLHENEKASVQEHRDRRLQIKLIREEAFQLCHARVQKAEEVKREALLASIKRKSDRVEAIKKGNQTLMQLRGRMEDVMSKATFALKEEIQKLHLKKHDQLNTEDIASKALEISEKIILPNLERRFPSTPSASNLSRTQPAPQSAGPERSIFSLDAEDSLAFSTASTTFTDYRRGQHNIITLAPLPGQHQYFQPRDQAEIDRELELSLNEDSPYQTSSNSRSSRAATAPVSKRPPPSRHSLPTERMSSSPPKPPTSEAGSIAPLGTMTFSLRPQPPSKDQLAATLKQHIEKLGADQGPSKVDPEHTKFSRSRPGANSESGFSQAAHSHIDFQRFLSEEAQNAQSSQSLPDSETDDLLYGGWSLQSGLEGDSLEPTSLSSKRFSQTPTGIVSPHIQNFSRPPTSLDPLPQSRSLASDDESHLLRPHYLPLSLDSPHSSSQPSSVNRSTPNFPSSASLGSLPSLPSSSTSLLKDSLCGSEEMSRKSESSSHSSLPPQPHRGKYSGKNFSKDHPLLGGNGRWRDQPKPKSSLSLGKLSSGTQKSVVGPEHQMVEENRKALNQVLLQVIEEEKQAEEARGTWAQTVRDPEERAALERVFAEERQKASDRIIRITKEHEMQLKQLALQLFL